MASVYSRKPGCLSNLIRKRIGMWLRAKEVDEA